MKRRLLALALSVPLVLTACSSAADSDDPTTTDANQDNQIAEVPLPTESS